MIRNVISDSNISSIYRRRARSDGSSSLSILILLALTAWISHFFYFRDFGLYEDDYTFIADAITRDSSYLLEKLQYFVLFPQGRPVGFYCVAILAFFGDKIGGLWADYLLGFVITTLNSYLFYRLLKHTKLEVLAVTGGLVFCLFPADTTKILLTHLFILQISLTFLLLASVCYLDNRKVLSYALILGSLLSYESAFIVFFGIPLFESKWNRAWMKKATWHVAILIMFMTCVGIIRLMSHEDRVSNLGTLPTQGVLLQKIFSAMTIGPNTCLSLFVTAPLQSIAHWNLMTIIAASLCLGLFGIKFFQLKVYSIDQPINVASWLRKLSIFDSISQQKISDSYLKILQFLLIGLVLLCLSYTSAFTTIHYPPTAEKGRLTSVHLAATIGGSLVVACLLSLVFIMAIANRRKPIAAILLSLYLACLVGYQFTIQIDFKQSWQNQRNFWTDVLVNSPDLDEKTTILVVDRNLPQTDFILTHSWAEPLILKQILQPPIWQSEKFQVSPILSDANWTKPPVLFLIPEDWQSRTRPISRSWNVPITTWQGYSIEVVPETTILLEQQGNHLVRINQPIMINGKSFNLKQKPSLYREKLQHGPLFQYLIKDAVAE